MKLNSTRSPHLVVHFADAVMQGLATDGGLFLPKVWPNLPAEILQAGSGATMQEIGVAVTTALLSEELSASACARMVNDSIAFDAPLRQLEDRTHVLELFHGPTFAFKDFGARFLARVVHETKQASRPLTVIVATSGDTGSAVGQAFQGLAGVKVFVLFPKGKVSLLQQAQICSIGGNVQAVEVRGDFDDCQKLVKQAFADKQILLRSDLTSANSINIARLIPQSFYYLRALAQLPKHAEPPVFSVPSGNFGNLTAGIFARFMGMRVKRFIAATNTNDAVPRYLAGEEYATRALRVTVANAMDVAAPSNWERLLCLFGNDRSKLQEVLFGVACSDSELLAEMKNHYQENNYILCPHTAAASAGLRTYRQQSGDRESPGVILATAHPAKFGEVVERAIGKAPEVPAELMQAMLAPSSAIAIENSFEKFRELVLG